MKGTDRLNQGDDKTNLPLWLSNKLMQERDSFVLKEKRSTAHRIEAEWGKRNN